MFDMHVVFIWFLKHDLNLNKNVKKLKDLIEENLILLQ